MDRKVKRIEIEWEDGTRDVHDDWDELSIHIADPTGHFDHVEWGMQCLQGLPAIVNGVELTAPPAIEGEAT